MPESESTMKVYIIHDDNHIHKVVCHEDNLDYAIEIASKIDYKIAEYDEPSYPPITRYTIFEGKILVHFAPCQVN